MDRFRIFKDFLNLSRAEKTGIWLLFIITITLPLLAFYIPLGESDQHKTDFSLFEQQISAWEKAVDEQSQQKQIDFSLEAPTQSATLSRLEPFNFDPNKLSADEWSKLGLSDWQTGSIMKFRQRGGEFRTKADFQRMYVISEEEYTVLEPFIMLPEKTEKRKYKEPAPVEINSADSTALEAINGIGPSLAHRIIGYRSKLHGFVNVEQLREVYGLDSVQYATISPQVFVNPYLVKKINVNRASFDELRSHPYIENNVALSIINYRKQHGDYQLLSDIKKSVLVTDNIYIKISPYLTVQ
ncbi:MAG: hypothetical protein CVU11_12925 [Bacteroidetes bacterium HGW-Bacteroidetes-6]|jgi:competence ComEA-like helix-hairpin-helix protein|nr:MAG: hypothetical protein CVU11_12925 [Bacteroidetes bacterium HGW-Bacteroidetes-6]